MPKKSHCFRETVRFLLTKFPGERLFIPLVPADRGNGTIPIEYVSVSPDLNICDSFVFGKFANFPKFWTLVFESLSICYVIE